MGSGEMVMCSPPAPESSRRRGGKTKAAEQKANKQPQRGLGVAQLEKIRLHNQMMAAYHHRSAAIAGMHQDAGRMQQVPLFAGPSAGGSPPFQPSCSFETTGRGMQYYDNLLPYSGSSSPPPPSLFAHDLRDSSGHRLGQGRHPPAQQHYWPVMSSSDGSSSAEELDLELRL